MEPPNPLSTKKDDPSQDSNTPPAIEAPSQAPGNTAPTSLVPQQREQADHTTTTSVTGTNRPHRWWEQDIPPRSTALQLLSSQSQAVNDSAIKMDSRTEEGTIQGSKEPDMQSRYGSSVDPLKAENGAKGKVVKNFISSRQPQEGEDSNNCKSSLPAFIFSKSHAIPYRSFGNQGNNNGKNDEDSRNPVLSDIPQENSGKKSPEFRLIPIDKETSRQTADPSSENAADNYRSFGHQTNNNSTKDEDSRNASSPVIRRRNESPEFTLRPIDAETSRQTAGPSSEDAGDNDPSFGNQANSNGEKDEDSRNASSPVIRRRNESPEFTLRPIDADTHRENAADAVTKAPQDNVNLSQPRTNANTAQRFSEPKEFSTLGSSAPALSNKSESERLGAGLSPGNFGTFSSKGGSNLSNTNRNSAFSVASEDRNPFLKQSLNQTVNPGDSSSRMMVGSSVPQTKINSNSFGTNNTLGTAQAKTTGSETSNLLDSKRSFGLEKSPSEISQDKLKSGFPFGRFPPFIVGSRFNEVNQELSTNNRVDPSEGFPRVSIAGISQDSTDKQQGTKRNVNIGTQDTQRVDAKTSSYGMPFYPSQLRKFGMKDNRPPGNSFYFSRSPSPPERPTAAGIQPSPPEHKSDDVYHGSPRSYPRPPSPHSRPLNDISATRSDMRELRVEDALSYLDRVKLEFGDRPSIYNEFLGIMKDFKAHILDTPGVIMKVSQLFRGYNHLILGFNMFLPDGYRISIKDLMQGGKYAGESLPSISQVSKSESVDPMSHVGLGMPREQPPSQNPFLLRGGMSMSSSPSQGHILSGIKDNSITSQGSHPPQSQMGSHHQTSLNHVQQIQQAPQEEEGNFIEFDHAITFVTKIKRRFADEPRVYQQFLEILHTYQKEQRGIKDVLEQVSVLFADHPDLLKQFTYFLPEAVQEQAKERLNAAAAEAEARKMALHTMEAPEEVESQSETMRGHDMEVTMDMTVKESESAQSAPVDEKCPSSPQNVTVQYPVMPETLIYNSGVERQFFDLAKESLRSSSREGDLAWAEFLKCMDLYAQEILSKNDMLKYMEDLLGKQHVDLFEEFKRILSAAGAAGAPSHDEAWHSVPLSEIDFSRCRRCTPSYRALPRDYPAPPFSGRSTDEAKLLNDIWISLPDGSEESYTFRHMRKNQHEEVLFRCEDERFEIDMVIDSTVTALNRLEPIAEEIAMLQEKETFSGRITTEGNGLKTARDNGGIGGKTIKYSFDKTILNTIHRHAITRIYGESGQEMLDLMQRNPVVAIPVVVKRLKQKYKDFRAAREVLNRRWKELAEINYYKSIDHRSLTWRAVDKRATSTRTLAAEIKDRAINNGLESEATIIAKRDKAKEEFGSFYERTMGRYLPKKMDLYGLPKPVDSIFTPHYSMSYENNSWAQRDAYRIISFALERGSTSPTDKERCHRLWTDFLAPFFDLGSIWIRAPAASYAALPHHHAPSIVSNGDDSGNEDDESSADDENDMLGNMMVTEEDMKDSTAEKSRVTDFCLLDNQPIPSGATISTVYGDGTVVEYRTTDKVFVVSLQCGAMAFLTRKAVLCTILPVDPYNDLEHPIETNEDPLERDDDKFILGPQSLYLFFRLHQILIKRLNIAKKLAHTVDKDQSLSTLIEQIIPDANENVGQKRYEAFLCLVYGLFDGVFNPGAGSNAAEGGKYEDRVRCLLGHNAYELATMDKLVSHILKHLQNLANDDTMQGMIQIFRKHLDVGAFKPQAFRQEAALISEGENIFAFQYCHTPKSDNAVMHIELLGCIADVEDEDSVTSIPESNDGPVTKKQRR